MIESFLNQATRDVFDGKNTRATQKLLPSHLHKIARRKLDMVQAASVLIDLQTPPSNHLERLQGKRNHQYSIRINDQYHIVFTWFEGRAGEVEIIDYH